MAEIVRMRQRASHKEQGDKLSNNWRGKKIQNQRKWGLDCSWHHTRRGEEEASPTRLEEVSTEEGCRREQHLDCTLSAPGCFVCFSLNRRYKSRLCSRSSCQRWCPAKQEIQKASQSSWNKALHLEPCTTEKLKSVCSKHWGSLDGGGSAMAKICLSSDRLAVSKEVISLILTLRAQKWKRFLS